MRLLVDFALLLLVYFSKAAEDQKWVWGSSRSYKNGGNFNYDNVPHQGSRYEVFEGERPYPNPYPPDYTPIQRPGGVYGGGGNPGSNYGQVGGHPGSNYGQGGGHPGSNYGQGGANPGILTGPVPSWVQDGPIKDFDRCKCTEKFNCPSPGISYGHCDVGKQYCCFSTKKLTGGPIPSRPIHSAENGILVGPGGPFDAPPRRPGSIGGGRPGSFGLGGGGNRRPGSHYDNGVLIGPGGPFDRPYDRSAKN